MRVLIFVTSLLLCMCGCASHNEALKTGHRYRLFFPPLSLATADGERIESVEVTMTCGRFRAITVIPDDWSAEVIGPSSERTVFRASCGHGSSALWSLRDLDGVIVITIGDVSCFEISAKVVSAASDDEHQHQFTRSALILRP